MLCARSLLLLFILLAGCSDRGGDLIDNAAVSGLRIDTLMGDQGSDAFLKAQAPGSFVFPEDHGAHPGFRSEWWYLTAVLNDNEGNHYGLHYTLFRQALTPEPTGVGPWHTGQAFLGHLAVTDVSNQLHLEAERFSRGHPGIAGVEVLASGEFDARIEDWALTGQVEPLQLWLRAEESDSFSVDVRLNQTVPLVLQGERGFSEKGPGSASYYYSAPRLEMDGTIRIAGREVDVAGLGWLDREWSTSLLGDHLSGWDWLALQLDDNRSLMVFQLRRKDGTRDAYDHGLLVEHDLVEDKEELVGSGDAGVRLLKAEDFSMRATRTFRDANGVAWPVSWELKVFDETFLIEAMVDDQQVNLAIVYWEGIVEVLDKSRERIGRGYMELTGYDVADMQRQSGE